MPRHLAIGDIHGCYRALQRLCEFVSFRDDDVIVTLGDYCNRGSNTAAVIDWLIHFERSNRLKPLRGNHEIMMLNARNNDRDYHQWIDVGGDATLRSYAPFEGDSGTLADVPEPHWQFLSEKLLPYFETDSHFFVHANAYPDIPLNE